MDNFCPGCNTHWALLMFLFLSLNESEARLRLVTQCHWTPVLPAPTPKAPAGCCSLCWTIRALGVPGLPQGSWLQGQGESIRGGGPGPLDGAVKSSWTIHVGCVCVCVCVTHAESCVWKSEDNLSCHCSTFKIFMYLSYVWVHVRV